VAAGKLLALDEAGMITAIGHAANQSAGIRQGQSTDASHFSPAHAARCGLQAALLAMQGFECSDNMLEGPKGFAVSFAKPPNPEAAIASLGQTFEISTLAYKPYPSGVVIHPIIDACLEINQQKSFDAAQIEHIELTLNPLAAKLTDLEEPKDRGQALVSLQHWAVATLVYKQAGIAEVANSVVRDPAISALRKKVRYTNDDTVGREAAHVRLVLKDGTALYAKVQHCRGSVKRPLTDDDITTKTRGQLRTVFAPDAAEKILEQSWEMANCADAAAFCGTLSIQA
jgi:2-methylcitrate dehydratase PrpD